MDRFGNKELLYRDLNISSSWPIPLRPRDKPPAMPFHSAADGETDEGTFFVQNVYESWTPIPAERISRLRVIQVLAQNHARMPATRPLERRDKAPGKQVLGTVPVEAGWIGLLPRPGARPSCSRRWTSTGGRSRRCTA